MAPSSSCAVAAAMVADSFLLISCLICIVSWPAIL